MWKELSSEEWDAIVTRLRGQLTQAHMKLAKAQQAERFERNAAQREWLQHQADRRVWFRLVMFMWAVSVSVCLWGRFG